MPSRIILVPLSAIFILLTLVCGLESTAIVCAAAGAFAIATGAFSFLDRPPRSVSAHDAVVARGGQP